MSNAVVHRPHAHQVPLLPVVALIVAVLIAATIVWAIEQSQTTTTATTTDAIVLPVVHANAIPAPESPVFRHAQMRVNAGGGYPREYVVGKLHLVEGSTLGPADTNPYGTARYKEPKYPR